MSAEVLDQVWTAEMAFLRDMYLLDADFFRFVWDLLQQPEAEAPRTATVAVHAGTKVGGCSTEALVGRPFRFNKKSRPYVYSLRLATIARQSNVSRHRREEGVHRS